MDTDALVFPSRGEGFGPPLAEAMGLGKLVITTAYGGQSDFYVLPRRPGCAIITLRTPRPIWACSIQYAEP